MKCLLSVRWERGTIRIGVRSRLEWRIVVYLRLRLLISSQVLKLNSFIPTILLRLACKGDMVDNYVTLFVSGRRTASWVLAKLIIGIELFNVTVVILKFAHLIVMLLLRVFSYLKLKVVLVLILLLDFIALLYRLVRRLRSSSLGWCESIKIGFIDISDRSCWSWCSPRKSFSGISSVKPGVIVGSHFSVIPSICRMQDCSELVALLALLLWLLVVGVLFLFTQ